MPLLLCRRCAPRAAQRAPRSSFSYAFAWSGDARVLRYCFLRMENVRSTTRSCSSTVSTGDLGVQKQIFPALFAPHEARSPQHAHRGGRPKATSASTSFGRVMKESLVASGASLRHAAAFDKLARNLENTSRSTSTRRRRSVVFVRRSAAPSTRSTTSRSPPRSSRRWRPTSRRPTSRRARASSSKNPSATTSHQRKRSAKRFMPTFPRRQSFGSITTLGKESVQNLEYFRAANPLIESCMNAEQVESVQITMAETFGVEGRAKFYDAVGAVRDVVQNHLLEIVACLAMDLPAAKTRRPSASGRAGPRLLTQVRALKPSDIVRGQVRGYAGRRRDRKRVEDGDLRCASRLRSILRRWKGVPFYLPCRQVPPRSPRPRRSSAGRGRTRPCWKTSAVRPRNHLRFRIGPNVAIALGVQVKSDGESHVGRARGSLLLHRAGAEGDGAVRAPPR